jgi:5-(carboxyamino)imidazole ribonucleotide synthase
MRPHNSGHFSIDAARTSQFEQHLRAVLDLPLGETDMIAPIAVMINLLGVDQANDFVSHYQAAMKQFPQAKFHSYQKGPRQGRKMGHITVMGTDLAELLTMGQSARDMLYRGA